MDDSWIFLATRRQSLLNLPSIKALILSTGPTFQNILLVLGLADTLVPHRNRKNFCSLQVAMIARLFVCCVQRKSSFSLSVEEGGVTSQSSSQRWNFFYASDVKRNLKHPKEGKNRKCMWIKINMQHESYANKNILADV